MPKVKDLINFLIGEEGIQINWLGNDNHLEENILGVSTDQGAEQGDLAWISPKQAKNRESAIGQFRGALLLGPMDIQVKNFPYAACNMPKLAFIFVVNKFFSKTAEMIWPANEQHVHESAYLHPDVVLAPGVVIGSGVTIEEHVVIGPNSVIANTSIRRNTKIGSNCSIGLPGFGYEKDENGKYWRFPHLGKVIIGEGVEIGSNTCIDRGSIGNTVIEDGVKIDNLVHIAHNVSVGSNTLVIAHSMVGGSSSIEENVWVAPSVSIMNQIHIGQGATLGMGAVVIRDVADHTVMVGNPAKPIQKDERE